MCVTNPFFFTVDGASGHGVLKNAGRQRADCRSMSGGLSPIWFRDGKLAIRGSMRMSHATSCKPAPMQCPCMHAITGTGISR